jgi:histidinol-phosphatase (PHP family)
MEGTCARAVDIGLPAVAFTEHADHASWAVLESDFAGHEHLREFVAPDGMLTPPELDLDGYLECLQRCREQFPGLRIISGVELGEPHWHGAAATKLLDAGQFDLALGSLHGLLVNDEFSEMPNLYRTRNAADVIRAYLTEVACLIEMSDAFSVLAHVDYPIRYWPTEEGPFNPDAFEDEFRHVLTLLADSGRTLEVNTRAQPHAEIVRWWREAGGESITFGSDAHTPEALAQSFAEAASLAEAHGFRPGRDVYDFWTRSAP